MDEIKRQLWRERKAAIKAEKTNYCGVGWTETTERTHTKQQENRVTAQAHRRSYGSQGRARRRRKSKDFWLTSHQQTEEIAKYVEDTGETTTISNHRQFTISPRVVGARGQWVGRPRLKPVSWAGTRIRWRPRYGNFLKRAQLYQSRLWLSGLSKRQQPVCAVIALAGGWNRDKQRLCVEIRH